MAAEPLFIDTGGFYALVSPGSSVHERAKAIMQEAAQAHRRAVTTDYVVDEIATLLRARGLTNLLSEFFQLLDKSKRCPSNGLHRIVSTQPASSC